MSPSPRPGRPARAARRTAFAGKGHSAVRSALSAAISAAIRVPVCVAVCAILALTSGCTSDPPNGVGRDLDPDPIDVVLQPLSVDQLQTYSALDVDDTELPVSRRQVLYLGSQGGTSSSILVNFDFGDIFTEDYPESLFTAEHIKTVKLSLTMLEFYAVADTADTNNTEAVAQVFYNIHQLEAPFDSTAFPGPVPPFSGVELSQDPSAEYGAEPLIPLYEQDFLDWLQAGQVVGLLIEPDSRSEPGLVGYGSRELSIYGELQDVAVGTVVAPNFVVAFEDVEINFLLPPVADTSTFHEIGQAPLSVQDGFIMRTGLRSYPALRFDFSALPPDAYINRAVFCVANDTLASFGPLQSLVVCELDTTFFDAPLGAMTLQELEDEVYTVTGMTSVDPRNDADLRFDVTQAVQRIVNGVYTGTRGLVLTAGEDFAPNYDQGSVDPDFYVGQFRFHGLSAADSLRPRIEVTYSLDGDVAGGAR